MSHRTAPPGTTVYAELDVDVFPAQTEKRGSRILGSLAVFFGASFTILPVIGMVKAVAQEGWSRDAAEGAAWFALPLVLFVALLLWGVNQFLYRLTIVLDGQDVRWSRRSLRGSTEDLEPLARFDGIRGLDRWSSGEGTLYELLLQHPDASKTVLLYRANRPAEFVDKWRRYCQVFSRPPVEYLAPEWPYSRDVDDLGRPLASLIRESKLTVPDPGERPERVQVEQAGNEAVVRIAKGRMLTVSRDELQIGYDRSMVVGVDAVDTITIEPGRPPSRKPWLRLTYRHPPASGGSAADALSVNTTLAEGLPLDTLQWLQRFLLRGLAGSGLDSATR